MPKRGGRGSHNNNLLCFNVNNLFSFVMLLECSSQRKALKQDWNHDICNAGGSALPVQLLGAGHCVGLR